MTMMEDIGNIIKKNWIKFVLNKLAIFKMGKIFDSLIFNFEIESTSDKRRNETLYLFQCWKIK